MSYDECYVTSDYNEEEDDDEWEYEYVYETESEYETEEEEEELKIEEKGEEKAGPTAGQMKLRVPRRPSWQGLSPEQLKEVQFWSH